MNSSSNNDNDLELARAIERANQKKELVSADVDDIASQLLTYRKIKKSKVSSSNKEQIWEQINTSISAEKPARILSFISSKTQKWAAAAVILISATLGILYFQNLNTPSLVAEANASISTVTLADGSTVTLRPYSKLYSQLQSNTEQTYSLDGEAFFDVTKNANRTFSVETDKGIVSVLGTRFNVNSRDNAMRVFLEEGKVQVQSLKSDSLLILNPGEAASITEDIYPVKDIASAEETLDWLNEELVFTDKIVANIISEIEHHYNVQISIPNNIGSLRLTGQLSLTSIDATITDLGLVLDGVFVKTSTNTYSFNSNN